MNLKYYKLNFLKLMCGIKKISCQVRAEITEDPKISDSFSDPAEFEAFVQDQIEQRVKALGLDTPWYSPQRIGLTMYKILIVGFGAWAYLVRNFMIGIMQEDFISAKRAMGISQKRIIYGHAIKNAAPPIITILALSLSGSLGGAIITEAVFDWPGMGRLYFEAITVMDLPVIIGATYVLTLFFLISILVADLLYGYFDPRVKTGS